MSWNCCLEEKAGEGDVILQGGGGSVGRARTLEWEALPSSPNEIRYLWKLLMANISPLLYLFAGSSAIALGSLPLPVWMSTFRYPVAGSNTSMSSPQRSVQYSFSFTQSHARPSITRFRQQVNGQFKF